MKTAFLRICQALSPRNIWNALVSSVKARIQSIKEYFAGVRYKYNPARIKRNLTKSNLKRALNPRGKIFPTISFLLLLSWSFILLFMLFWAICTSLKTSLDFTRNPFGLPKVWAWENYRAVYKLISAKITVNNQPREVDFWGMFINSLLYCIGVPFFAVLVASMASYIACGYKQTMKGVRFLYGLAIFTSFVPISPSLAATLRLLMGLKLYDSMIGMYIYSSGAFGFMFMVYYATFKNLPWSYAEAAFIDGAGHFRVFATIMLPLTSTVFGALFITTFIGVWTDYMVNVVFLPSYPMLAYGAFIFQWKADGEWNGIFTSDVTVKLAGMLLLAVPIFVLFMLFKNKLMGALTMGGLKG